MDTIPINSESINAYQTILEDPEKYGMAFLPLKDCFEPAEAATPKHILFKEFLEYIKVPLPKVFFYIIMDSLYQQRTAPDGNLGYLVKLKKFS